MNRASANNPWLHRFAVLTALATLGLMGLGGLVTSKEAGMSVPDWPTSYGYNMFALPFQYWTGGVFYEHTHRLWATVVGTLVVALTRWLGGARSRKSLVLVGVAEIFAGFAIFSFWPHLKATGHFLTGIGGVVLLAGIVWVRNAPASPTLVRLGWTVFWLVQFQGLLGGLRVVLFKDQIGIFHGALAQIFFVLLCTIVLMTSRWWQSLFGKEASSGFVADATRNKLFWKFLLFTTALIFFQLILGATMRHQHAGLAISDFPLSHGQLWPATDPDSIIRYNAERIEITNVNPITAFQVQLQMAHRIVAVLILCAVGACAWFARKTPGAVRRFAFGWLGLIMAQVGLGAATVLTNKAADIATAHVLVGALSLATGATLCILASVVPNARRANALSSEAKPSRSEIPFARDAASDVQS